MWDEATGAAIKPQVGFSLRASLAAGGTGAITAQINPFTEVATAAAFKAGGLTMANVARSNTEAAAVLTFNPLDSLPQFDASTRVAKNAAAAALTMPRPPLRLLLPAVAAQRVWPGAARGSPLR